MHSSTIEVVLDYEVSAPSHFVFNLEAARFGDQSVTSEALVIEPTVEVHSYADESSGNRFLRFDAPVGPLRLRYSVDARRAAAVSASGLAEMPVSQVPDDILHYLMPTRYCESDLMSRAAQQLFGHLAPGIGRVQAVTDWIHESITYQAGSSDSTTTACEVFVQRAGVCRDFAHLGITLCRALNLPARLVVGYVYFNDPPQDFHAVFEAWLGGRWVLFDPTRMAPVDRLVRVGTGRDAKDVAFCTIFGPVTMKAKSIDVREFQDERGPAPPAPEASGSLRGIEKPVPVTPAQASEPAAAA